MPPGKNDKCSACGGYEFSLNDGFMYCDRCGALLENFEELEEEEGGMQQTLGRGRVKVAGEEKKRKVVVPLNLSNTERIAAALEKRTEFLRRQKVVMENLPYDTTPDYLYGVGVRLFAFTQILSKTAYILVHEMSFEPSVQKNILATFQKYLAHCQVAFCSSEQCGNDEQLRFVAIMENVHFEEEERAEKRRKKLARRGKGVKALSRSAAAWTLLTQGNLTENLDIGSDEEEEEGTQNGENEPEETFEAEETVNETTMGFVRKVTTALSREALRRAAQIVLNLEILVAILQSALLSSGYRNVFASDIVRWIREDRFRISRMAIKKLMKCHTERVKKNLETSMTNVEFAETFLRFPLYEITRTTTLFHQSLKLEQFQTTNSFEKLSARMIDNLNLPVDILSRILLLESIVPCDVTPTLLKQVDIKMGHNFQELSAMKPKLAYYGYLSSFGRKEAARTKDAGDEVLLSPDTKIIAYVLLALKLTFDIDESTCSSSEDDSVQFDIDTWIHQFEMRLKCWQGHDMSRVLRQTCPIPEMKMEMPFGNDSLIVDNKGVPLVVRSRRQVGFRKCVPSEMIFNSTSSFPTVFDVRQNRFAKERTSAEAILTPLKFQKTVLRKEMDQEAAKFECIDPVSEKTFFRDFTNYKTTEVAENFDDLFPHASGYSQYARPDWISSCTARKTETTPRTGPLRFLLSNQACDELLDVASASFSARFRFLLSALSLTIGEDEKAVYAAFVMLEMHLTGAEGLERSRQALVESEPIPIEAKKFDRSSFHYETKYGIVTSAPIGRIEDLRFFDITHRFNDHPEMSSEDSAEFLKKSRLHEIREALSEIDEEKEQKRTVKTYGFERFFEILAIKFW